MSVLCQYYKKWTNQEAALKGHTPLGATFRDYGPAQNKLLKVLTGALTVAPVISISGVGTRSPTWATTG